MKPKAQNDNDDGLLEYLEDIIGTSKYKTPIEESSQELDRLNDVCAEKSTRVKHVEKERAALEGRRNIALEYARNENALAMKQFILHQVHIKDCKENIEITEELIQRVKEEMEKENAKYKLDEGAVKEVRLEISQAKKQMKVRSLLVFANLDS